MMIIHELTIYLMLQQTQMRQYWIILENYRKSKINSWDMNVILIYIHKIKTKYRQHKIKLYASLFRF